MSHNNTSCVDCFHLQNIYDQILACFILVVALSILILCKLLETHLEKLFRKIGRSLSSSRNESFELSSVLPETKI